jgi:hypothetical protein
VKGIYAESPKLKRKGGNLRWCMVQGIRCKSRKLEAEKIFQLKNL